MKHVKNTLLILTFIGILSVMYVLKFISVEYLSTAPGINEECADQLASVVSSSLAFNHGRNENLIAASDCLEKNK